MFNKYINFYNEDKLFFYESFEIKIDLKKPLYIYMYIYCIIFFKVFFFNKNDFFAKKIKNFNIETENKLFLVFFF